MIRLQGTSAARGIAIGPAFLLDMRLVIAERRVLRNDREAEVARLETALSSAEAQLNLVRRKVDEAKGSGREFIEAHRLILRSPELAGEARRLIKDQCLGAEWAVSRAIERIRLTFSQLDNPFFRGIVAETSTSSPSACCACCSGSPSSAQARVRPAAASPWARTFHRSIHLTCSAPGFSPS